MKYEGNGGCGMKDEKKRSRRTLAEILAIDHDIPPELLSGGCFVEIRGRSSVVVHGCKKILVYTETRVVLKMHKDILEIIGSRLTCLSYLAGAVSVEGLIDSVSFGGVSEQKKD